MFQTLDAEDRPIGRALNIARPKALQPHAQADRLFEKLERFRSGVGLAMANVLIVANDPGNLEGLAAGQGANVVWAQDIATADMKLSIAHVRPHFLFLKLEDGVDLVHFTETVNHFRHKYPDIAVVLLSEKFLQDETGKARPRFCEASVALPTTPEKLQEATVAAQKNRRNLANHFQK
jgi:hypothetical protein